MKKQKPLLDPSSDHPLPSSRWILLGDTLRYRFWDVVGASILAGVFFVPFFAWLMFVYLTGRADPSNFFSILMTYLVAVPLLMIGGLGEAGLSYFFKKLVWGQGASLSGDFFEGIAKNFKTFLGVFLGIGLLYLLLKLDLVSLSISTLPGAAKAALEGASYALFFILLMPFLFLMSETVIYEGGFFSLLSNGFRFTFGAILLNIPLIGAYLLPFIILEFIPYIAAIVTSYLFATIFYFAFASLFFTLYSHSLFDRSINKDHYPEIIRKGLAKTNEGHDHDQ